MIPIVMNPFWADDRMSKGVTLENTEKPKCAVHEPCLDIIQRLEASERPLDISADPKCR
jgi:hypothetical protein